MIAESPLSQFTCATHTLHLPKPDGSSTLVNAAVPKFAIHLRCRRRIEHCGVVVAVSQWFFEGFDMCVDLHPGNRPAGGGSNSYLRIVSILDVQFTRDQQMVIANTAAFHFGTIEQGGTSLYAAMAHKASNAQVLKIVLGIGRDEIARFLEWVDFAGNSVQPPVAPVTDQGLTFPDFTAQPNPLTQPNLIFPVPCEFINSDLPKVAIIRSLNDQFAGARAAVAGFKASGLFLGQTQEFLDLLDQLAEAADAAQRG